jgi:hypothetical protein
MAAILFKPFENRTNWSGFQVVKQNGGQSIQKPDQLVRFLNGLPSFLAMLWQPSCFRRSKTGPEVF